MGLLLCGVLAVAASAELRMDARGVHLDGETLLALDALWAPEGPELGPLIQGLRAQGGPVELSLPGDAVYGEFLHLKRALDLSGRPASLRLRPARDSVPLPGVILGDLFEDGFRTETTLSLQLQGAEADLALPGEPLALVACGDLACAEGLPAELIVRTLGQSGEPWSGLPASISAPPQTPISALLPWLSAFDTHWAGEPTLVPVEPVPPRASSLHPRDRYRMNLAIAELLPTLEACEGDLERVLLQIPPSGQGARLAGVDASDEQALCIGWQVANWELPERRDGRDLYLPVALHPERAFDTELYRPVPSLLIRLDGDGGLWVGGTELSNDPWLLQTRRLLEERDQEYRAVYSELERGPQRDLGKLRVEVPQDNAAGDTLRLLLTAIEAGHDRVELRTLDGRQVVDRVVLGHAAAAGVRGPTLTLMQTGAVLEAGGVTAVASCAQACTLQELQPLRKTLESLPDKDRDFLQIGVDPGHKQLPISALVTASRLAREAGWHRFTVFEAQAQRVDLSALRASPGSAELAQVARDCGGAPEAVVLEQDAQGNTRLHAWERWGLSESAERCLQDYVRAGEWLPLEGDVVRYPAAPPPLVLALTESGWTFEGQPVGSMGSGFDVEQLGPTQDALYDLLAEHRGQPLVVRVSSETDLQRVLPLIIPAGLLGWEMFTLVDQEQRRLPWGLIHPDEGPVLEMGQDLDGRSGPGLMHGIEELTAWVEEDFSASDPLPTVWLRGATPLEEALLVDAVFREHGLVGAIAWTVGLSGQRTRYRSKPDIDAVIKSNLASVQRCYQQGLREDPSLSGRAALDFVLGSDGVPRDVQVASTWSAPKVDSCIRVALYRMEFGGGYWMIQVHYPFVFSPEERPLKEAQ
ncbi:MAG: AgmX/PglI C-terminal domain-containing protein [Myxococcota bacterium]|nr:AgmX/PglI C-terminal domain-containing protein [Myxococcota bacterium]